MNRNPQSDIIWQTVRNPKCTECELHKDAQTVCLLGNGPVPADGMIIGEAPGYREDEIEIPFSGKSGIFLRQCLKDIGLDPRSLYITNAVACRPPANRTPTRKETKTCSSLYLYQQITHVRPKAILLLGNTAISAITGRKATVTKMEGTTIPWGKQSLDLFGRPIICVPCRHPSSVIRVEDPRELAFLTDKFKENLRLFRRELLEIEDDFKFIEEFPTDLKPGWVYVDLETNSLNPFLDDSTIWSMTIVQDPAKPYCFKVGPEHTARIKKLITGHPLIVHRGTFEGTWLRQKYGITIKLWYDTKLGAFLVDENEPTGLKYQAIKHLKVEPWSEEMDWKNPDIKKLLPYNARDGVYGTRLFLERDRPFLEKNKAVAKLAKYIVLPAQEVFIEAICNGFHINVNEAEKKIKQCEVRMKKENDKLDAIAGYHVNPGSPKQMVKLLYDEIGLRCPRECYTDKGKPSTSEAALIRLKGQHEALDILLEWRKWRKFESTYLRPWIKRGPILHANYGFTATDTGRLNSTMVKETRHQKKMGATLHQCPRDPFIRNIVTARGWSPHALVPVSHYSGITRPPKAHPEDWVMVAGDLSQAELRLVANASGDRTMLEVFNSGGDIHRETALTLVIGEITKELRKRAKAVNFGFVYGMLAPKFQRYALEKYDVKLTMDECQEYRNKFFRKYNGLLPWHKRVEAFVSRNGYIDSIFGRRRHLPLARLRVMQVCTDCLEKPDDNCFLCGGSGYTSGSLETNKWVRLEAIRQAINSPIQSAGSDLCLLIAALIGSYSLPWAKKIDKTKAFFVGSAHDSLLFECHRKYVEELKENIRWTVKNLPLEKLFNIKMKVPILMDVAAYDDYWEGKELAA